MKISFASGATGSVIFSALLRNPTIGAALGVLLILITAAALTIIEARLTTEDPC